MVDLSNDQASVAAILDANDDGHIVSNGGGGDTNKSSTIDTTMESTIPAAAVTLQTTSNDSLCILALRVCEAVERGDYTLLGSLLDDDDDGGATTSTSTREALSPSPSTDKTIASNASATNEMKSASSASKRCQLLFVLQHLIGHKQSSNEQLQLVQSVHTNTNKGGTNTITFLQLPLSVRAHLILRALLRPSTATEVQNGVVWEAVTAVVKSLQYTTSDGGQSTIVGHGEEVALIGEIRSFVSDLTSSIASRATEGDTRSKDLVKQILQHLFELGETIVSPLLLTGDENGKQQLLQQQQQFRRREHSYLLPLELFPVILGTLDVLDDLLVDLCTPVMVDDMEVDGSEPKNDGKDGSADVRMSDNLLALLFASINEEDNNSHRTIRADASLPLLALAMDDIGNGRMSTNLPLQDDATFWDGLRLALSTVIRSNLMCYIETDETNENAINDATFDEGSHIIPSSDYPALIRCVFRMITTNPHHETSQSTSVPSWQSLFLQLYHAAAIATASTPKLLASDRRKKAGEMDRVATLATVESHVLIPSFTGASVSTIRSILDACTYECCPSCKRNAAYCQDKKVEGISVGITPTWAVAGVVLLMMRARASNLSTSANSTTGFGPRDVFRMASDMLRKNAKENGDTGVEFGLGSNDEVGNALKVLLNLPVINEGVCRLCSDTDSNNGADASAYKILKDSYYAGNDKFLPRYSTKTDEKKSYQRELGLQTVSMYANLVRSSLNQGSVHNCGKVKAMDSCIADTARTWIDAANILLDDRGKSTADGTAMAIVIIVVIFCEVPSSQHDIVQSVYNRLVNVVSGNNHDDASFTLVSTLTWSLASSEGKISSSDVVQRRSYTQSEHMSVFGPLCSLLSRSVATHDKHYGLTESCDGAPCISYGSLRRLARSLSSVPSGREAILSMSKKHMRVLSAESLYGGPSTKNTPFFEAMPCTSSANRDAVYFAVECLCMLVEIYHPMNSSSLDECGREALSVLADIIVLHRPLSSSSRLPIQVISWLLRELNSSAVMSRLSVWSCRRLLRACFMSLLRCCDDGRGTRAFSLKPDTVLLIKNGISCRLKNDVAGMLQLAVTLYDYVAVANRTATSSEPLVKRCLISTFLDRSQRNNSSTFQSCLAALQKTTSDYAIDDTTAFLAFFIEGSARMIAADDTSTERDTTLLNEPTYASIQQLKEYLISVEHAEYSRMALKAIIPNWTNEQKSGNNLRFSPLALSTQQNEDLRNSHEFKQLSSSVCDILVEILLAESSSAKDMRQSASTELTNPTELDVLLCVNTILGRKRLFNQPGMLPKRPFSDAISRDTICSLFDLSSDHLKPLLQTSVSKTTALKEVDLIVKNAMEYCMLLNETRGSDNVFPSLWRLYSSMADEDSSRLIIAFIEDAYYEAGQWDAPSSIDNIDINESSFSLRSISSVEDLDDHVRFIRQVVLSALSQEIASNVATAQSVLSLEEKSSKMKLLLQALPKLCRDLDSGFHGHSGGMTKSLFVTYVGVVERCIDAVALLLNSDQAALCRNELAFVLEANAIIWNVFCENSLQQASLVKGTLRLCVDKMPSLTRKAERLLGDPLVKSFHKGLSTLLLEQCCVTLKKKTAIELEKSAIGGAYSVTGVDADAGQNREADPIAEKHDTSNSDVAGGNADTTFLQPKTPNLSSPEMLPWAHNIAFVSIAKIWYESYKLIGSRKGSHVIKRSMHASPTLEVRRMRDFASLSSSVGQLLEYIELPTQDGSRTAATNVNMVGETKPSGNDAEPNREKFKRVLAEALSYRGKSNLCTCLEKMAMALTSSTKQIIKYLSDSSSSVAKQSSSTGSIVVLLGWFSSIKSDLPDIITGSSQWFIAERRKLSLAVISNSERDESDDYPILGRLPKVLYRLEGLDAELRNLSILISDLKWKHDKTFQAKVRYLDEKTTLIVDTDDTSQVGMRTFREMLQEVTQTVDSRKNSMNLVGADDLFSEEEVDSEEDIDGASVANGKRRKRLHVPIRKSRRMILRSRNETIDDWLTLDDEEFGSAPGEKYNAEDAFADLEDFLVEG